MRRPPLITSIMANSSATRVGGSYRGSAFPTTAIFMRLVWRARIDAIRLGDGMLP